MARLFQLHHDTHPKRIAVKFGVTDQYVRQVWRQMPAEDMAPLDEAISILK